MPKCKHELKYRVVSPTGRVVGLASTWKAAAKMADKHEVGHYSYGIQKLRKRKK